MRVLTLLDGKLEMLGREPNMGGTWSFMSCESTEQDCFPSHKPEYCILEAEHLGLLLTHRQWNYD